MNYERIILELLERIQVLESKVNAIETQMENSTDADPIAVNSQPQKHITSKYRALTEYLLGSNSDKVVLTYPEIEKILGFQLPESAHNHVRQYWANTETHSYAFSWLGIGYRTRVDPDKQTVIFERALALN